MVFSHHGFWRRLTEPRSLIGIHTVALVSTGPRIYTTSRDTTLASISGLEGSGDETALKGAVLLDILEMRLTLEA